MVVYNYNYYIKSHVHYIHTHTHIPFKCTAPAGNIEGLNNSTLPYSLRVTLPYTLYHIITTPTKQLHTLTTGGGMYSSVCHAPNTSAVLDSASNAV